MQPKSSNLTVKTFVSEITDWEIKSTSFFSWMLDEVHWRCIKINKISGWFWWQHSYFNVFYKTQLHNFLGSVFFQHNKLRWGKEKLYTNNKKTKTKTKKHPKTKQILTKSNQLLFRFIMSEFLVRIAFIHTKILMDFLWGWGGRFTSR